MNQQDQDILEVKKHKNTLESYAYDLRDGINSKLQDFVEPGVREKLLKDIEEVVEWIYGEGEFAQKQVYLEKIENFRKIGEPIKYR